MPHIPCAIWYCLDRQLLRNRNLLYLEIWWNHSSLLNFFIFFKSIIYYGTEGVFHIMGYVVSKIVFHIKELPKSTVRNLGQRQALNAQHLICFGSPWPIPNIHGVYSQGTIVPLYYDMFGKPYLQGGRHGLVTEMTCHMCIAWNNNIVILWSVIVWRVDCT